MSNLQRDIDFLYEIGTLKNVQRGWRQHMGMDVTNVFEHSFRVAWLALIIAQMEGVGDEGKIVKMALVHDMDETRTSDLSYVQKVYVEADGERAAKETFEGTSVEHMQSEVLHEYEARNSIEAKIVKDADNLDIDIELKELEDRGSLLPSKWRDMRKFVRDEKLYTESAKKLWDAIQDSDPQEWHMSINKWVKMPETGR